MPRSVLRGDELALGWWIDSALDWAALVEASCGPARSPGVTYPLEADAGVIP